MDKNRDQLMDEYFKMKHLNATLAAKTKFRVLYRIVQERRKFFKRMQGELQHDTQLRHCTAIL